MDIIMPDVILGIYDQLPPWVRWLIPIAYLILDWTILARFARWSLIKGMRWLMNRFVEHIATKAASAAVETVRESLQQSIRKNISQYHTELEEMTSQQLLKLEERISERLAELNPAPPPHRITGTPCPKSGLYRVQGEMPWIIERTFEKGEILPTASTQYDNVHGHNLPTNEEKVTWVFQNPKSGE